MGLSYLHASNFDANEIFQSIEAGVVVLVGGYVKHQMDANKKKPVCPNCGKEVA